MPGDAIASVRNAFQHALDVNCIRSVNLLGIHDKGKLVPSPVFDVMCTVARNVVPDTTNLAVKNQLANCIGNAYARKKREDSKRQKLSSKFADLPALPQLGRLDSTGSLPAEPLSPATVVLSQPIAGPSHATVPLQTADTVVASPTLDNDENTVVEFTVSDAV